ncbi:hypothetical protein GE09DRAFT_1102095 [Coniochaeta sp. 2T2.1]|nr:hypothetical protein GE09DRAFT_1102095 [Coniochaeta sp. 2T2.1]
MSSKLMCVFLPVSLLWLSNDLSSKIARVPVPSLLTCRACDKGGKCYRNFVDIAPHARDVAAAEAAATATKVKKDVVSSTVDGYLVKRACFDYACDDSTDCRAVGCTTCVQTHTPCGDSVLRCR